MKNFLSEKEFLDQSEIILHLLGSGNLLPFLHFECLDKSKVSFESDSISFLYEMCEQYYSKKDYLSCIDTASSIHETYDDLDEVGLKYKIIALNNMKGHSKAQNEFELFKKRYLSTYKEEYTKSFDELIGS